MRSTKIVTKRAKAQQDSDLADLLNLGSVSAGWLKAASIRTPAELRGLASVAAFRRVAMHRGGAGVTYNLLYALEGALRGVRWDRLPVALRKELKQAVDAPPASPNYPVDALEGSNRGRRAAAADSRGRGE